MLDWILTFDAPHDKITSLTHKTLSTDTSHICHHLANTSISRLPLKLPTSGNEQYSKPYLDNCNLAVKPQRWRQFSDGSNMESITSEEENSDDGLKTEISALVNNFQDLNIDIRVYKTGSHPRNGITWEYVLLHGNLLVFIDKSMCALPGFRDGLVSLLEFAQDELDCPSAIAATWKENAEKNVLLSTLMFVGFELGFPSQLTALLAPQKDKFLFLSMDLTDEDSGLSEQEY